MKKLFVISLFIYLFLFSNAFATDAVKERNRHREQVGWSVYVEDDTIGITAELVTELDSTFAQLAAEDEIELISSDATDITQTVTIWGVDDSGNYVSEEIALDTQTGEAYEVTSSTLWRYIDDAEMDIEAAGTITIRDTSDTFITSIPAGTLDAQMAQHFNGEKNSYVTGWKAVGTAGEDPIDLELRWYPDDADCLDASDGYRVLDKMLVSATRDSLVYNFPQSVKCPAGGWLSVYGTGSDGYSGAIVTLQGYDSEF